MFDFLRKGGSTTGEKGQEMLDAYLDNALTPAERQRLESEMNRDPALRARLEQMRLLKLQMRAMPRRRVPRSFALDPALYGRPKAQPLMQLYPVLRGATALTAVVLIFTLALGAFQGGFSGGGAGSAPEAITMNEPAAEESAAEFAVPVEATIPVEEARIMPTAETAEMDAAAIEAPAGQAAPETAIEESAPQAPQPVEGTSAPEGYPGVAEIPQTDLALQEAAPTIEPEPDAGAPATSIASAGIPESEAATGAGVMGGGAAEEAGVEQPAQSGDSFSLLRLAQIALGVIFVLLFIFWLVARRRVRSL